MVANQHNTATFGLSKTDRFPWGWGRLRSRPTESVGAMDKISMMIPPPPAAGDDDDDDNASEEDEDWD